LHNNHLSLVVGQSVLQSVTEENDEWQRCRGLVWTSRWLWSLDNKIYKKSI
jgi:hypothetical protein